MTIHKFPFYLKNTSTVVDYIERNLSVRRLIIFGIFLHLTINDYRIKLYKINYKM